MQIHSAVTNQEKYFHKKQQPGNKNKGISPCWVSRHLGLSGSSPTVRTAPFQFAQGFLFQIQLMILQSYLTNYCLSLKNVAKPNALETL